MSRNPFAPIRPDELKAIAREATSDHMQHGTDLTDAVVKAASLFGQPLTSEHVKRVCEMTYHDTFERKFHEKTGSKDRLVSFDPPDAVAAAGRLRAEKVASARPVMEAPTMSTAIMDKVASVSATSQRRYQPINAFDSLIKEASPEPQPVHWHNPLGELCHLRQNLRAAISEMETRRVSLEESEKFAMLELTEHAWQAYKNGFGVSGILHACVSGTDREKVADGVLSEIASDLTYQLANIGCSLDDNVKVASLGEVNPKHPLPRQFNKIAEWRTERAHVEFTLEELRRDLEQVNEGIRAFC